MQEYAPYAQAAITPNSEAKPGEQLGSFDCSPMSEPKRLCTIKKPDGSKYMEFPASYNFKRDEDTNELTLTNEKGDGTPITIGEFTVKGVPKGGKITLNEKASCGIHNSKDSCFGLKVSSGNLEFQGKSYTNIKDGNFIISKPKKEGEKPQIEFAQFTASKPSSYAFDYKDQEFKFATTKKDSKVLFDPNNKNFEVQNADIQLDKINVKSTNVKISLGERCYPNLPCIAKMEVAANSIYKDDSIQFSAKSQKPLNIYFYDLKEREDVFGKDTNALLIKKGPSYEGVPSSLTIKTRGTIDYTIKDSHIYGNGESKLYIDSSIPPSLENPNPTVQHMSVQEGTFGYEREKLKIKLEHPANSDETTVYMHKDSLGKTTSQVDELKIETKSNQEITFDENSQLRQKNKRAVLTSSDPSYLEGQLADNCNIADIPIAPLTGVA